jgi:C-terminal processing protease CtpA/Prc
VDTGLDDAVHLGADEWQQWTDTLRSGAYTVEADYIPGQGVSIRHQILAREVQLGPIRLHQVMVSQAGEEQRKAGDIKSHAVIGLAALRELELYIDYPNRTAELRVTSKLKARPAYNRLGAVFVPPSPDSAARAAVVAPGSPAQEAGLRNGDVLLAIDEDRVSELGPLFELWRKPAGTPYVLHVKRGERTLALRVRLRDFLRAR